jgi:hypothetical protein
MVAVGLEAVPVSGDELEISGVLDVVTGDEAIGWEGAVNIQPPAMPARNINEVIADIRLHLCLFIFVQCRISVGWRISFVKEC